MRVACQRIKQWPHFTATSKVSFFYEQSPIPHYVICAGARCRKVVKQVRMNHAKTYTKKQERHRKKVKEKPKQRIRKSKTRVHRAAVDGCSEAFLGKPASQRGRRQRRLHNIAGAASHAEPVTDRRPPKRVTKQNLRRRSCGVKALRTFLWEGGGGKVGERERGESWSAARRPVSCTQITCIVAHSCKQIRWTLQCKAYTRLHIGPFHIHHKLQTVACC